MPCFYEDRGRYIQIMRSAIAINASFFNTQRMAVEYLYEAYRGSATVEGTESSTRLSRADAGE